MNDIDIEFEVNGQRVRQRCSPMRRLLAILREDLGLTGAKPGCEVGRCGACTVWLDEAPVPACLVRAWQLAGRRVTTIEQVAGEERSRPVRDALAACGGVQCGYCTAGFVMTLTHLHGCTPRPDAAEAAELACGNLCRCTGYGGIARALERLFDS